MTELHSGIADLCGFFRGHCYPGGRFYPNWARLVVTAGSLLGLILPGCVAFDLAVQSKVEDLNERPYVAILLFDFDREITTLSTVKTVEEALSPEEEADQLAAALAQTQQEGRWLLVSRLAAGQGFRIAPLAETDALAQELQLKPGAVPNAEQLAEYRRRLGVGLVMGRTQDIPGGDPEQEEEIQLALNLAEIVEPLGDSLTRQELLVSRLRGKPEVAQH